MYVCGLSRVTRVPSIKPSAASPCQRARNGPKRRASAIESTAMKPMLWRLRAWRAPGLPSAAMTSMGPPIDQHEGRAWRWRKPARPGRNPYFLAAGLAAAGAAAAFAGAAAPLAASALAGAPAAGAAGAAPGVVAAAATAGAAVVSSTITVGGTIVTTVWSALELTGRQPSGSLIADTCTES